MNKDQYVRMFEFGQIPVTVMEAFLLGYEDDEVYAIWDGTWFTSCMTSDTAEKTANKGKKIFATKDGFLELKKDFIRFRERAESEIEYIANQKHIDSKSYDIFFNSWAETYHYYRKMEFFYVDKIFGDPNTPEEIRLLGRDLGMFKLEARKTLNDFSFEGKKWGPRIFEKIAKQTGLNIQSLEFMERKEINSALEGNFFDESVIIERKRAYLGTNKDKKINIIYGDEALKQIPEFKQLADTQELKGVVAHKGSVKGTARVMIFDMSNISKIAELIDEMKENEILITETTSPEWMPACQKASAIVTAQGGILSHAAIVSRELNIPCIVGVSNILRVIKNGDFIEVDAYNGVVNVLKSKDIHI